MLAPEAHAAVVARLLDGGGLEGLGLTQIDGRWDLGGLRIERPTVAAPGTGGFVVGESEMVRATGITEFRDLELADVDLRSAELGSVVFTRCRFTNCVFDRADLTRAKSFGSVFVDCSFERASLREAVLGGKERGRSSWERVRFVGARMDRSDPASAVFVDCDFGSASLDGVEFWDAALARCRFEGRLKNVIFAARRPVLGLLGHEETLVDVDFSTAALEWVEFRGLNLDRVTLPSDPAHIVVARPRCVLEKLLAELRRDPAPDADQRGFMANVEARLEWLGPAQTQDVFAIHELGATDETRARAASMIRAAVAACDPAR